jgi:hypothetical protein
MLAKHLEILKDLKNAKAKVDALSTENGGGLERVVTPLKATIEAVENRVAFYEEEAAAAKARKSAPAPTPAPIPLDQPAPAKPAKGKKNEA